MELKFNTPFIDSTKNKNLEVCANLLNNPFEYFLREENYLRVVDNEFFDRGLREAILDLQDLQRQISSINTFPKLDDLFLQLDNPRKNILTKIYKPNPINIFRLTNILAIRTLKYSLHAALVEAAIGAYKWENIGHVEKSESQKIYGLLIESVWMASNIVLVLLGIAAVSKNKKTITFFPKDESSKINLRNCWFGVAFDELSLRAANSKLDLLRKSVFERNTINVPVSILFADAMSIFYQHWRLPIEYGPIEILFEDYLKPLIKLTINCMQCDKCGKPLTESDLHDLGLYELYEILNEESKNKNIIDKLIFSSGGRVTLSKRKLAHSLIKSAEDIAKHKYGVNWHNDIEPLQIRYFINRLKNEKNIEIIELKLEKHNTKDNQTPVDVDIFIRHKSSLTIYAIQLKHLQNSHKCGLLDWVERFRSGQLKKGIDQLKNLEFLINNDAPVQQFLIKNLNIDDSQLKLIKPILLHNIGSMDFCRADNGVVMYDINTFCNAIKGGLQTYVEIKGKKVIDGSISHNSKTVPSLHNPEDIVDMYVNNNDRISKDLQYFDFAKDVVRSLNLEETTYESIGLGI